MRGSFLNATKNTRTLAANPRSIIIYGPLKDGRNQRRTTVEADVEIISRHERFLSY